LAVSAETSGAHDSEPFKLFTSLLAFFAHSPMQSQVRMLWTLASTSLANAEIAVKRKVAAAVSRLKPPLSSPQRVLPCLILLVSPVPSFVAEHSSLQTSALLCVAAIPHY
jgi:hypothetical protein